jgi:hypothetical protein
MFVQWKLDAIWFQGCMLVGCVLRACDTAGAITALSAPELAQLHGWYRHGNVL